ncbi:SDR family oxidoreductase [Dyadobacter sp. CY327]|uniref:SDR family oxidoreductase n=1 Tax=Dyadobacter sp. CY327 TaxID=2907301 RepID=UPI001F1E257B|nr:SDR family oxidoreductase [Dyadobacter sp. CY327]MCE7071887.1 SDR family oxidoreductase [Dyadobacter sp. CY327]
MSRILVTGASGHLGKAAVKELLRKVDAKNISALVRDPAKVEDLKGKGVHVIQGDYTDYDSLIAAFRGVDKLYFVSSSDNPNRFPQHLNVVKAAVEAGVVHIFYTSVQRKSEDGSSPIAFVSDAHFKTDNLIKESGLAYTILRHGLYADVLPMFIGDKVIENGTIFLPAGDGKSTFVSRKDFAAAAANLLTSEGHENKIYEMCAPVAYSFEDIAGILSELSGKTIEYVTPSAEVFTQKLKSYGLPDEAIQGITTICVAIAQGEFDLPSTDLQHILGREPESVKDFLKAAYQL